MMEDESNKTPDVDIIEDEDYLPIDTLLPKEWVGMLMKQITDEEVSSSALDFTTLITEKFILYLYKQVSHNKTSKQLENLKYENVQKVILEEEFFVYFHDFFQKPMSTSEVKSKATKILTHQHHIGSF
ncbi:Histone-fold domain-containing protein [Strongyloides ratti]|uniref:Histone-fold domain-containing protein n=1 Tax=Strongyloides ratti TaxID=34506 RepID=A0A090LH43_STRRB|nr:Histone-fold domain-containing protein [Strongyloides ratti]CEF66790.1 Histone-fold domain-containing protein [Strongyloides ratti]